MTMSSAVSKVTLNGDGITKAFPFSFKVWKAADLEVAITNAAGDVTVVSNWSVSLVGQGGTVTYPTSGSALPSGHKITIRRSMDFLQNVDLVSGTRWDPEVVETALDQATAERQQLKEEVDRSIKITVTSPLDPESVVDDIFAARDSALNSAERAEIASTTVAYYNHEGTLLAGQSVITLPWAYDLKVGVEVFLSGVKQTESSLTFTDAYTVTLDTPVIADTPFEVVASAGSKGDLAKPSGAGGVGFVQLGTGAVHRTVADKLHEFVSVKDFGAVGDGVTDDTDAIQNAFSSGKRVYLGDGDYLVSDTITLPHPFYIVGNGPEDSSIIFTGMGGFAGKNGITISVPETAEFMSASYAADFSIIVSGANGKHAVEIPTALLPGGSIWATVRPQFTFERVNMRGGTKLTGGSLVRYDYGWARYWSVGDSSLATFRNCYIAGCFDDTQNPSVSTTKDTVGWFFSGLDDVNGGAVFMPLIEQSACMFVGVAVKFDRLVSNPRIASSQFHRCGYGIVSDRVWLGTDNGLSDAQFSNLNINACYGGISIVDTDFLTMTNVRCTRAKGTFNHANDWIGFHISNLARRISLQGCRAYYSNVDYTNTRYASKFVGVGVLAIDDFFIRHDGLVGAFTAAIDAYDCASIKISNSSSVGKVTNFVQIDGGPGYAPNVDISGISGDDDLVNKIIYSESAGLENVYYPQSWKLQGVDASVKTISAAGTLVILPKYNNQLKRFAFAAGAGPYTYNIDLPDRNSSAGDVVKLLVQINSTAGTNPTINIRDDTGATQLTLTGDGTLKKYAIDLFYTGTTWRISSAVQSLA